MGATGILTMSGAPESHLGILSREFQTPCVMTIGLTDSDSRYEAGNTDDAHFEAIVRRLAGKRVRLDCDDDNVGRVYLEENGA
jgi:signal transduction protein with GAF and PtsI domain